MGLVSNCGKASPMPDDPTTRGDDHYSRLTLAKSCNRATRRSYSPGRTQGFQGRAACGVRRRLPLPHTPGTGTSGRHRGSPSADRPRSRTRESLLDRCRIPDTLETSTALRDSQLAERAADSGEIASADLFLSLLHATRQSVTTCTKTWRVLKSWPSSSRRSTRRSFQQRPLSSFSMKLYFVPARA